MIFLHRPVNTFPEKQKDMGIVCDGTSIGLHCSLYSTEREGENNANNQMAINARAESGIGQINLLRKVKNVSL